MRLVKGIVCKVNHLIVDAIRHFLGNPLRETTVYSLFFISVNKTLSCLFHFLQLLLTHGTAKQVGISHGKAGKVSHNLHNLLLVDNNAIGIF